MTSSALRHLLVLCCNGGQPFVDFHDDIQHKGSRRMDPTDWSAEDIEGSSLLPNSSSLSSLPSTFASILSSGVVSLDECDIFNLTFSSTADQQVFERFGASLACRCPLSYSGVSCESSLLPSPQSLVDQSSDPSAGHSQMLIILCVIALALFFFAFMMFRGCFCDCFGPFKWPGRRDEYDKELDSEDVERALAKVRAYEERQRMSGSATTEVYRPLVVPSVSSSCPFDQVHPSAPPAHLPSVHTVPSVHPPPPSILPRSSSPPPAYSSVEHLPQHTDI